MTFDSFHHFTVLERKKIELYVRQAFTHGGRTSMLSRTLKHFSEVFIVYVASPITYERSQNHYDPFASTHKKNKQAFCQ